MRSHPILQSQRRKRPKYLGVKGRHLIKTLPKKSLKPAKLNKLERKKALTSKRKRGWRVRSGKKLRIPRARDKKARADLAKRPLLHLQREILRSKEVRGNKLRSKEKAKMGRTIRKRKSASRNIFKLKRNSRRA